VSGKLVCSIIDEKIKIMGGGDGRVKLQVSGVETQQPREKNGQDILDIVHVFPHL
jgi:hypothetical protein